MGTYSTCWLDNFRIGTDKGFVDPNLITLFRPSDKIITSGPVEKLPPQFRDYDEVLNEHDDLRVVFYAASAHMIRDRLDVIGYSLETAKRAFSAWIDGELRSAIVSHERVNITSDKTLESSLKRHYQHEIDVLSRLTPDLWIEALQTIRDTGLKADFRSRAEALHDNALINYMLTHEWYGFPGYDRYVPLRLAIEACKDTSRLIYDVTELTWEFDDFDHDFIKEALEISAEEYAFKAKTIVLTEGKTDTWILHSSLELLFPHLQDYYSFLDFEGAKVGGGVGNLANMVKAFAGAGIINNVVALFDNDTAAAAALKPLETLDLGSNIVVRKLPAIDFLRQYPTVGPSGNVLLDVNGIAASIELYLGEDVLTDSSGNLFPVQWTGYERGLGRYQGEVLEKDVIHDQFRRKLKTKPDPLGSEWDGLRAVLNVIFTAFNEQRRKMICQLPIDYYSK